MIVDCPDCTRSYHLSADDIGDRGRLVVCPRCDARWFQQSDEAAGDTAIRDQSWDTTADSRPDRSFSDASRSPSTLMCASWDLRGPLASIVLGLLVAFTVATVAERELIVGAMPRTARMFAAIGLRVNVRGLDFARVMSKPTTSDDITIAGDIRNVAGRRIHLPRVAFEIRDGAGATLVSWSESPPAVTLVGGRTISFQSEPHRVPPNARTVLVHFDNGDAVTTHLAGSTF